MEQDIYTGLGLDSITLVKDTATLATAREIILGQTVVGFDTEAKPTFVRGQKSGGPHVVQVGLADHAFIFQVDQFDSKELLEELIESPTIMKVGFGIKGDAGPIRTKLGLTPRAFYDLHTRMPKRPDGNRHGLKSAFLHVMGRELLKSKNTSKSNWANARLSESQLRYAANDAHASLLVYSRAYELGLIKLPGA